MEYGMDTVFVQCQEQLVTNFPVRHQQVVKVMVRLAFRRDMRPHDMSLLLELLELLVVKLVGLLAGPVNLLDRFQLGQPRLRGFASDGIGPRAGTVAGGNETGDSLGGDAMICGTARLFGPPPLPSATLANAGVRTHAWASGGIVLPGPLRALAPVANSLLDWQRWSASVGLGVSVPVGSMGLAEVNVALAHWGSHRDLRQQWSLSFTG